MLVIELKEHGHECIEITDVFDRDGKPVVIKIHVTKVVQTKFAARVGCDAPQSVSINKVRDIHGGTKDDPDRPRRRP